MKWAFGPGARLGSEGEVIEIPLGAEGLRRKLAEAERRGTTWDVPLLDEVVEEMRRRGYSETAIGRAIFEDALDWQAKKETVYVKELVKRLGKVPKRLTFEVTVPKVE